MDLQDKTAVVTGGARRVGREICLALAERGCNLVVHYNASEQDAQETSSQLRKRGVRTLLARADLSHHSGVSELFKTIDHATVQIDILVNSAAIMEPVDLLEATNEDWQRTVGLNLEGAFFCLQQAARRMQIHGGLIVNISDVAGLEPWPRFPIHSISKAGIEMLTRVAALALAPHIRVNAIAPGPVLMPDQMKKERWKGMGENLPLKRTGSAQDVSRAVIFLAENEFITGETLVIDGGARWV